MISDKLYLDVDILNSIKDEKPIHTDAMLKVMIKEGLVSGRTGAYERIRITPKGTAQLIAYREQLAVEAAKIALPQQPSNSTTDDETAERMEKEDTTSPKKPTIKQRLTDFFHLVGGTKSFIELIKLIWNFFS